jgi:hypothetical protein
MMPNRYLHKQKHFKMVDWCGFYLNPFSSFWFNLSALSVMLLLFITSMQKNWAYEKKKAWLS